MKCTDCNETILPFIIDNKLDAIPLECKKHLDQCEICQREIKTMTGWVSLLRDAEEWKADDVLYSTPGGFIHA